VQPAVLTVLEAETPPTNIILPNTKGRTESGMYRWSRRTVGRQSERRPSRNYHTQIGTTYTLSHKLELASATPYTHSRLLILPARRPAPH
jgi:hypothetical protein